MVCALIFGRSCEPSRSADYILLIKEFALCCLELFHFPCVARPEKLREIARPTLRDNVLDLLIHDVFVARKIVPRAKHADGRGETWAMLHVRKQEGVGRARVMSVMHNQV